ncbi:RNA polymerase-binding protein DksA [Desulfothermus okinawensis JCM 13304]
MLRSEDLKYFRNQLEKMLEEIEQKGKQTIEEMVDSSSMYPDPADRASVESEQFFALRLRDRERKLRKKILEAIERIDNGTYGICEGCGGEIGIARLKARPVTTLCIECKNRQEEEEKLRRGK